MVAIAREHVGNFGAEQAAEFIDRTTDDPDSQAKLEPCPQAITTGARVLVADERGVFIVTNENKDGSLTCYPVDKRGVGARSFRRERCVPAERRGRDGKACRVRSAPPSAQRACALWRERHGFPSFDHVHTVSAAGRQPWPTALPSDPDNETAPGWHRGPEHDKSKERYTCRKQE